jgi:hypothetical protein
LQVEGQVDASAEYDEMSSFMRRRILDATSHLDRAREEMISTKEDMQRTFETYSLLHEDLIVSYHNLSPDTSYNMGLRTVIFTKISQIEEHMKHLFHLFTNYISSIQLPAVFLSTHNVPNTDPTTTLQSSDSELDSSDSEQELINYRFKQ